MNGSFFLYFFDPVLRAPMIGSMLMCIAAALVGVIVFLKKQALIGEALSHAAYPGVVLGAVAVGLLFGDVTGGEQIGMAILIGAFITSIFGMQLLDFLQRRLRVYPDSALCFVLSFFFGLGILFASRIQFTFSNLYRQVQTYFYGQAATLTDLHIALYATLVLVITLLLVIFRKEFKTWIFDPHFSHMIGLNSSLLNILLLFMVTLSVVIGVRSVGVVLMSAMLIAPAVAARQCTDRLRMLFILAAIFSMFSAMIGTYLANEVSWWLAENYPRSKMVLPTGPMIVLIASFLCLIALLFAPEKGMIIRFFRILRFRSICLRENLLKTLWRLGPSSIKPLQERLLVPVFYLKWILLRATKQGWVQYKAGQYLLTKEGQLRAGQIVRLHRLWELYLADYLGIGVERVHANAEEMEHVLTPDLEEQLTELLNHPTQDPHHQPIPPKQEVL